MSMSRSRRRRSNAIDSSHSIKADAEEDKSAEQLQVNILQDLGQELTSGPGFGHPGQDLDIRARIWASRPGSWHPGQDLGIRVRI